MKNLFSLILCTAALVLALPATAASDDPYSVTIISSNVAALTIDTTNTWTSGAVIDVSRQTEVLLHVKLITTNSACISNIACTVQYSVDGQNWGNAKTFNAVCNGTSAGYTFTNLTTYGARQMRFYDMRNNNAALCAVTNYSVKYVVKPQF